MSVQTSAQAARAQAISNVVPYDVGSNRRRLLQFMQHTHDTTLSVLTGVSQATATTLRDAHDGDKGWTVLEVLCHVRDFDNLFRQRAQLMCAEEYPALPAYDHEQMAKAGNYNAQQLVKVIAEYSDSRRQTITFFTALNDELWLRAAIHPERGHFTMLDAALQIGLHDMTHLEQITRILFNNK